MIGDPQKRAAFVSSSIAILENYAFDGCVPSLTGSADHAQA